MKFRLSLRSLAAHLLASFVLCLFLVQVTFGQGDEFCNPICGCDGVCTLYEFLFKILSAVVYIAFPVLVLMIVYTGFLFVVAQGKPQKIQEARQALWWTVIGGLVILGAKALAIAVEETVKSIQG